MIFPIMHGSLDGYEMLCRTDYVGITWQAVVGYVTKDPNDDDVFMPCNWNIVFDDRKELELWLSRLSPEWVAEKAEPRASVGDRLCVAVYEDRVHHHDVLPIDERWVTLENGKWIKGL